MTEVAAVYGIVRSVVVAVSFALVCVMLFIDNVRLAVLCTVTVLSVVTCTFGALALAGWSLGTVEAICITMLVGLSVDYAVHLSDSYIHNGLASAARCAGVTGGCHTCRVAQMQRIIALRDA